MTLPARTISVMGTIRRGDDVGAFNPAVLFADSELGFWLDPSDLSTMFQDTAGTTPVTADGQLVARINDKSGNGNNVTQATEASRPTYRTDGTLHWLEFDGTNDSMVSPTINFNTASVSQVSVFAGIRKDSDAAVGMLVELSTGVTTNIFNMTAPNSTGYGWRTAGSGANADVNVTGFPAPESAVLTGFGHITSDISTLRRNGVELGTNDINQFSGPYRNAPIYIGARNGASVFFNGNIYGLIVRGKVSGVPTPTEEVEAYLAAKSGVTL